MHTSPYGTVPFPRHAGDLREFEFKPPTAKAYWFNDCERCVARYGIIISPSRMTAMDLDQLRRNIYMIARAYQDAIKRAMLNPEIVFAYPTSRETIEIKFYQDPKTKATGCWVEPPELDVIVEQREDTWYTTKIEEVAILTPFINHHDVAFYETEIPLAMWWAVVNSLENGLKDENLVLSRR